MQKPERVLPVFLNMDSGFERLDPNESPFLKSVESGINANPAIGNNNPTGEGQNAVDLTPTRSNLLVPGLMLPPGYNKLAGSFYSEVTKETYLFYYNEPGQHSIWVLSGDTGILSKVIQDSNLPIVADQEAFLAQHKVKIRVIYDKIKNVLAKFLVFATPAGWQGWINVIAAMRTNGFDSTLYPYWTLMQPHYDRRELIEWAIRPPMYNPTIVTVPNTAEDAGKVNRIIDQPIQIAMVYNYTDGRRSEFSPYSLPLIVKSEDFLSNPDIIPKKAVITMYAGSCMLESIDIMIRYTAKKQVGIPSTASWGDWQKYIRLYKYAGSSGNPSDLLSSQYWLRTNPWSAYNYDSIQNTIQYVFDNSILPEFTKQPRLQNDIPIRSVALTDLNDAAALLDNLDGYDNLPATTINNLDAEVVEKPNPVCPLPTRKVTLYAVVGRPNDDFTWESQVGYYDGLDTQMRWGSLSVNGDGPVANFSVAQSKQLGLDFADHSAFVCYAKGTPFYVVGQWYLVEPDNTLIKLPALLDFGNNDVLTGVQEALLGQKYYVCVFNFELPAGRYDFCIGRHNINLTADFRGVSTYVYGIANSRIRTPEYGGQSLFVEPNAIVSFRKEMEIDCTTGDVDVWGNGHDLFFIYCPYPASHDDKKYRFLEGYLKESPNNQLGCELFPYFMNIGADDWGQITDKNGFYFAYTKKHISGQANIEVTCKLRCTYPVTFQIPTNAGSAVLGPINNGNAYLSDHNDGGVGPCNRVLIKGKITDLTGTIPYSNISVSIANGGSVTTGSNGEFTLIVHNGEQGNRIDNIYVSAAGNFLITLAGCDPMPLTQYNEALVPCFDCLERVYPFPVNFKVLIQGGTQFSVKENSTYQVTAHVADYAGRLGFENVFKTITVPSFNQRNDVLATFIRALKKGPLNLHPDYKWIAFSVSNQVNLTRYIQWVGDNMKFIDNQGNVVDDPSTAVFISISINSLYNYAISKNFSVLTSYQFSPDDRLRILDDGSGNLLDTANFGSGIDTPVLGTNYNQAMQNAGIIPSTNTVPIVNNIVNNNTQTIVNTGGDAPTTATSLETTQNAVSVTLYIAFDSRLAALKDSTGFWIEIFTPAQQPEQRPYNELQWYPVVNGEPAIFKSIQGGIPVFDYPTTIDLPFWDTYLFFRNINIPNVGDKFLNHPFESPNISDSYGANVSSGGRLWEKNDDAAQQWKIADIIPSDDFIGNGILNGLGTFRAERRKNFGQYPFGAIQAAHTERSIIFVLCENDWFTLSFDFHFTFPNPDGVMVTNLDGDISKPAQKIGSNYGLAPDDTNTVIFYDRHIYWYDRKNEAWVFCDYRTATDVTDLEDDTGKKLGVKSYFVKKTKFVSNWNTTHGVKDRFDVSSGIDIVRKNIHITFRPRRNNSNDVRSYINRRRNVAVTEQETIVYNISTRRWTRFTGFTPEAYSQVSGLKTGVEFLSFAAGQPYYHNKATDSFLNFFGQQTEPIVMCAFNKPADMGKVLVAMSYDTNDSVVAFYADLIYTSIFNSFSYIPLNYLKLKNGEIYSQVLKDMNTYPPTISGLQFLSMLQDGKRIYDVFFIIRFVGNPQALSQYFQMNNVYALLTQDNPIKK